MQRCFKLKQSLRCRLAYITNQFFKHSQYEGQTACIRPTRSTVHADGYHRSLPGLQKTEASRTVRYSRDP